MVLIQDGILWGLIRQKICPFQMNSSLELLIINMQLDFFISEVMVCDFGLGLCIFLCYVIWCITMKKAHRPNLAVWLWSLVYGWIV